MTTDNKAPLAPRPGLEWVVTAPENETIVSMLEYKGDVYIATNRMVYKLIHHYDTGHALEPLMP